MRKTMTAAAALLLGVAFVAGAQANGTLRQSATTKQQTVQTGTTAPHIAKKHMATKRMTTHRRLAKLTRHHKQTQMARLHHKATGTQQQTETGSSTMPNNNLNLNSPSTLGSGSSTMPQDQITTPQNQNLQTPSNPTTVR